MELALIVLAVAVVLGALILAFARPKPAAEQPADPRLDEVSRGQGAIAEQFRQTSVQVEALKQRLGDSLSENATKTAETLGGIGARLSVIDEAQKNISALSGQVVSLQQVLANKQARGAFGQAQMEEIVRDGVPSALYDLQATLANRNRPDCIIHLPGHNMVIVIDSKFPLEGFVALREAAS